MDIYLAAILIFGGNFNPNGFEFCQGQLLPISQNKALYSLPGVVYSGNRQSTFALPNMTPSAGTTVGTSHIAGHNLVPAPLPSEYSNPATVAINGIFRLCMAGCQHSEHNNIWK